MFELKNKSILIISPQNWGSIHISKHHYAIELAETGNRVFYLNPPSLQKKIYPKLEHLKEYPGLSIIHYKPIYRAKKYIPIFLFEFLVWLNIRLILTIIGKPDIIWSFEDATFYRLDWFKTKIKIFHPVDLPETIGETARYTDIIFSVSETILSKYKEFGKKRHFINHGLNNEIAMLAQKKLHALKKNNNSKLKIVGYVGNLFMEALDRPLFKKVIEQNPEIQFIIWGPYEVSQSNIGYWKTNESTDFINFLKKQQNVELRGVKMLKEIYTDPILPDLFLILYNPVINKLLDISNSHKILEYLSTGKVIVSNFISTYKNSDDLIIMPTTINGNHEIPELFKTVKDNLAYYNNSQLQSQRISFALANTYKQQIKRIEEFIQEI